MPWHGTKRGQERQDCRAGDWRDLLPHQEAWPPTSHSTTSYSLSVRTTCICWCTTRRRPSQCDTSGHASGWDYIVPGERRYCVVGNPLWPFGCWPTKKVVNVVPPRCHFYGHWRTALWNVVHFKATMVWQPRGAASAEGREVSPTWYLGISAATATRSKTNQGSKRFTPVLYLALSGTGYQSRSGDSRTSRPTRRSRTSSTCFYMAFTSDEIHTVGEFCFPSTHPTRILERIFSEADVVVGYDAFNKWYSTPEMPGGLSGSEWPSPTAVYGQVCTRCIRNCKTEEIPSCIMQRYGRCCGGICRSCSTLPCHVWPTGASF